MNPNPTGRAAGQGPLSQPSTKPDPAAGLVSGFATGTIVLTQDGETPVEHLSPGDRIITRGAGLVRLIHVSRTRQPVNAVFFAAGSLGHTRPGQDLVLPAGQPVLIRDWRARAMFGQAQSLASAGTLVDGEFIRDLGPQTMLVHQLHFDHPQVVYAGGLELACPVTADTTAALRRAA